MSLRLRLFVAMAALAVASVLATALLTRGGVRRVVQAYVLGGPAAPVGGEAPEIRALTDTLVARWSPGAGFTGGGPELAAFTAAHDRGVLLVDSDGAVVAATGVDPDAVRVTPPGPDGAFSVEWSSDRGEGRRVRGGIPLRGDDGTLLGALLVLPKGGLDPVATAVGPQGAIDRRIAMAAGLATGLALLAALLVARQIAEPVTRLAGATLRLAAGDRSQRIVSDRTDEVGQLVAAFNHLADSLETSEGLRRRLVADVAHELRTPLTALQGRIETMQDGLAAPDAEGLGALHADVAHLTDLVAELQDLALAEAGQLRLDPVPVDLRAEAENAARALGLGGTPAPGRPVLEISGDPVTVLADPGRLRQILTNLLSNAVHHAAARTLRIHLSQKGDRGVVAVADDGVGIDPEALPHIFERLYRADTRDPGRPGSGLGLAITRELVRMHGGDIAVASTSGEGTTFTVELPRVADRPDGVERSR